MKTMIMSIVAGLLLMTQSAMAGSPEVKFHAVNPDMQLPFSEAVQVGHTLYLSGQLGYDAAAGKLVDGGITAETQKTLENIQATLEKHGASMSDVVKCTVFLAEISEWAAMNSVYVTFFPENPPARSAVGGTELALGARTEIECIAVLKH